MGMMSMFKVWPSSRKAATFVSHDAVSLIDVWGEAAYDVAANLSWREDSGLIHTSNPGHWARVQREIGARLGIEDQPSVGRRLAVAV